MHQTVFTRFVGAPRAGDPAQAEQQRKTRHKRLFQNTLHIVFLLTEFSILCGSMPHRSSFSFLIPAQPFSPPKYTFSMIVFWKATNRTSTGMSDRITPAK